MKNMLALILAAAMVLSLTACGGSTQEGTAEASPTPSAADSIQVDEGLFNVKITLPKSMVEDSTEEELLGDAAEEGITCTVNDDGSATYTMSKSQQKELLDNLKSSVDSSIDELLNGENAAESFQKIEYANDLSSFDVYVDRSLYEQSFADQFSVLGLFLLGAYYQIFDGVAVDDLDVVVNILDAETGETIDTTSYQDMLAAENSAGTESETAVNG